ncbi:MAG: hypothetical protein V3V32_04635 [Dehalococcoidia bacterium]
MFILLEYKDEQQSGACGHIAVWLFEGKEEATEKMGELSENDLPLDLYEVKRRLLFH